MIAVKQSHKHTAVVFTRSAKFDLLDSYLYISNYHLALMSLDPRESCQISTRIDYNLLGMTGCFSA